MRVEVSQLVPGCVLLDDVLGKSGKPIIPSKTILTDEHITVLQKFMERNVNVASTLTDGAFYTPAALPQEKEEKKALRKGKTRHEEKEFIERCGS